MTNKATDFKVRHGISLSTNLIEKVYYQVRICCFTSILMPRNYRSIARRVRRLPEYCSAISSRSPISGSPLSLPPILHLSNFPFLSSVAGISSYSTLTVLYSYCSSHLFALPLMALSSKIKPTFFYWAWSSPTSRRNERCYVLIDVTHI